MKLKFISIRELETSILETLARFPLLVFFLAIGAGNHLYMDIYDDAAFRLYSRDLFMTILVFAPALYSIRMLYESGWVSETKKYILEFLTVCLAVAYFHQLPIVPLITYYYSQFWLYFSISLFSTVICVKDHVKNDDLFWHFHVSLISRALVASLYTGVLIAGTSAALGAVDLLFNTKLMDHQEIRIIIVTLWLFYPVFFLAGVPESGDVPELMAYKPKWLKNISIYVLLPLTAVYLGILYAYIGKILIQQKLPDGTVSYLVLSFAAFGITSLILIYPFQKDENSKWSYWFCRCFYYLQFPLLILLGIAIYRRIEDYGITFRRYYLIALAVWLLFITVFMTIRKNRNLIVIPLSLFIIASLSAFGPWGAFGLSFRYQKARLLNILTEHSLIVSGKLSAPKDGPPQKVQGEIISITRYLKDYRKLQSLAYLTNSQEALTPEKFTAQLGFVSGEGSGEYLEWFEYSQQEPVTVATAEYPLYVKYIFDARSGDQPAPQVTLDGVRVEYSLEKKAVLITDRNGRQSMIPMSKMLTQFSGQKKDKGRRSYSYEDGFFKIIGFFNSLEGRKPSELSPTEAGTSDKTEIKVINADFFIRVK